MLNLEPSAYLITIITLSNEYTVKEYIHIRGPVMARGSCGISRVDVSSRVVTIELLSVVKETIL